MVCFVCLVTGVFAAAGLFPAINQTKPLEKGKNKSHYSVSQFSTLCRGPVGGSLIVFKFGEAVGL